MTLKQLHKLIGRNVLWTPPARDRRSTLKVRATIEAVRQTCGRSEVLIVPTAGKGNAWIWRSSLTLLPVIPTNLY